MRSCRPLNAMVREVRATELADCGARAFLGRPALRTGKQLEIIQRLPSVHDKSPVALSPEVGIRLGEPGFRGASAPTITLAPTWAA